jgi:MFS transporter, putative metabolite:H+ symporter
MSAEQFGTNLRATAAISNHNLVRGLLPIILLLFQTLRHPKVLDDYVTAAWSDRYHYGIYFGDLHSGVI